MSETQVRTRALPRHYIHIAGDLVLRTAQTRRSPWGGIVKLYLGLDCSYLTLLVSRFHEKKREFNASMIYLGLSRCCEYGLFI